MDLKNPDSYPYPDTQWARYEEEVRADAVWKSDGIVLEHGIKPAAEVKTGTKWTHITDKNGATILRVERDAIVKVLRRHETAESREAYRRAERNRRLCEQLTTYGQSLERARRKLDKELDEYHYVDYSALGDLMEAQAERRLWARFEATVNHFQKKDDFTGDLVDVFDEYAEGLKQQLVEKYRHRSLSRSTSIVSNLLQDVETEVIASFLSSLKWWV